MCDSKYVLDKFTALQLYTSGSAWFSGEEKEKGKLILITSHLLSELDDLITEIIFMQEGKVHFHQKVEELKTTTGEERISKAIAKILKNKQNEPNH